jgi:hypothetical protein
VHFNGVYFDTITEIAFQTNDHDLFAFSNSYMFYSMRHHREVWMYRCNTFGIPELIQFQKRSHSSIAHLAANDEFLFVAEEGSGIHQYDLKKKTFRFEVMPLLQRIVLQQKDVYAKCSDGTLCILDGAELTLHTTLWLGEKFKQEKWKWDASDKGVLSFCVDPHVVYELHRVTPSLHV